MMFSESFIMAVIAEIGIIAIALVFDAEYVNIAIGLLAGLLGGYGVAKGTNSKEQSQGSEKAS